VGVVSVDAGRVLRLHRLLLSVRTCGSPAPEDWTLDGEPLPLDDVLAVRSTSPEERAALRLLYELMVVSREAVAVVAADLAGREQESFLLRWLGD
jgi:hypothetical protein